MLAIHGGKKGSSRSSRKSLMRYGGSSAGGSKLTGAATYNGLGTLPGAIGTNPNFSNMPMIPPKSTQVGGAYGYSSGNDAAIFGGNYAPPTKICTGGDLDPSRGGNNFMSGGTKRRGAKGKRSGSKRTKRTKRTKHTKHSRSKRRGGKKWPQKGCRKLKGGLLLV